LPPPQQVVPPGMQRSVQQTVWLPHTPEPQQTEPGSTQPPQLHCLPAPQTVPSAQHTEPGSTQPLHPHSFPLGQTLPFPQQTDPAGRQPLQPHCSPDLQKLPPGQQTDPLGMQPLPQMSSPRVRQAHCCCVFAQWAWSLHSTGNSRAQHSVAVTCTGWVEGHAASAVADTRTIDTTAAAQPTLSRQLMIDPPAKRYGQAATAREAALLTFRAWGRRRSGRTGEQEDHQR